MNQRLIISRDIVLVIVLKVTNKAILIENRSYLTVQWRPKPSSSSSSSSFIVFQTCRVTVGYTIPHLNARHDYVASPTIVKFVSSRCKFVRHDNVTIMISLPFGLGIIEICNSILLQTVAAALFRCTCLQ